MRSLLDQSSQVSLERVYPATLDQVWRLWTSKAGIESWWGPEGFTVEVQALDLKVGGELHYIMKAVGAQEVAFMTRAGMPLETATVVRFVEIEPLRRLAYVTTADFVPGVAPYEIAASVELSAVDDGVRMVVLFDRLHDAEWTERASRGWLSQLAKLDRLLVASEHIQRP